MISKCVFSYFLFVLVPAEEMVCIAGRYCESGDILIENVMLSSAGAYCLPMVSNYNLVPRPAVLLVDEQKVQLMERLETYDDILSRYSNV